MLFLAATSGDGLVHLIFGPIIDALNSFVDAFRITIQFIADFFSDVVFVIGTLVKFLAQIPAYFSWLPGPSFALIGIIFSCVVIYKVIGRS